MVKRKIRLVDVLFHCSLIATGGCDGKSETEAFASFDKHAAAIDRCLNDPPCSHLWCEQFLPDPDFSTIDRCDVVSVTPDGVNLEIEYTESLDCGRRPAGFVEPSERISSVAAWLSRVATLEAASITAFRRLAVALAHHSAPRALIANARRAIADEIRHAELVGRLARRLGAIVARPRIDDTPSPTLIKLAVENAVEGQVGETIGALVATCQARAAATPQLRATFGSIARDEARHAELAHVLAAWLDTQLTGVERATVATARTAAIARSARDVGFELDEPARDFLGLPAPASLAAATAKMFTMLA